MKTILSLGVGLIFSLSACGSLETAKNWPSADGSDIISQSTDKANIERLNIEASVTADLQDAHNYKAEDGWKELHQGVHLREVVKDGYIAAQTIAIEGEGANWVEANFFPQRMGILRRDLARAKASNNLEQVDATLFLIADLESAQMSHKEVQKAFKAYKHSTDTKPLNSLADCHASVAAQAAGFTTGSGAKSASQASSYCGYPYGATTTSASAYTDTYISPVDSNNGSNYSSSSNSAPGTSGCRSGSSATGYDNIDTHQKSASNTLCSGGYSN